MVHAFPVAEKVDDLINLIPIRAVLSLETSQRQAGSAVTLTWDVKKITNKGRHKRYNNVEDENYHTLIKEFEIFGYKDGSETSLKKLNGQCPWTMVRLH